MLWTALEDPDPVLIFENVMLYNRDRRDRRPTPGPVDIDRPVVRRARASTFRLITYGGSLFKTLEAAEQLAKDGHGDADVIDLRTCGRSIWKR
jgi:2-oxoisovalerate dehydrogenase E1 component